MKIFQLIQKKFLSTYKMGLNQHRFNWKNLLTFFGFCMGILSNGAYSFYEAKTFQEFANSICVCTVLFTVTIYIALISVNMPKVFGCVSDAEQIINASKLANLSSLQ